MTAGREDAPESEDSLTGRIDSLTESGTAFALYRFPRAGEPVLVMQTAGPVTCLDRLEELNGRTGFVFAPFEITDKRPVVLLNPDIRATGTETIASLLSRYVPSRPVLRETAGSRNDDEPACLQTEKDWSQERPGSAQTERGGNIDQAGYLQAHGGGNINRPSYSRTERSRNIDAPVYPQTAAGGDNDRCDDPVYPVYAGAFRSFAGALKGNEFEKLVLSRPRMKEKTRCFSPAQVFFEACRRYPTAFVYLFHTSLTGTWLGSTPETLLAEEDGRWHTVALAGTKKAGEEWDAKNRREQELVAGYLRELLQTRGISWEEKGPYPYRAGKVIHLLTDFYFDLSDTGRLGDLVASLHPTPAVCGLPKEKAFRFICRNEGYDRAYYSGFAGWLSPAESTALYVNLRCMQVGDTGLTLYAGGGLLPSSELEAEWKETEDKLQTLLDLLHRPVRQNAAFS